MFLALSEYMKITCHACIGGTNVNEDRMKLDKGTQVVVGTPGRVHDMIQRGSLSKLLLGFVYYSWVVVAF